MTLQFIVEGGVREAAAPLAPSPIFALAGEKALRLPQRWRSERTLRYLESCVARNPRDLISHVRRVWLSHDLGDAKGTAAAAIDLFIATQDKGRDLRQRILTTFAPALRETGCEAALAEALDGALSRHDPRVAHESSLLCRPVAADFAFVRRVDDAKLTHELAEELRQLGLDEEAAEIEDGA